MEYSARHALDGMVNVKKRKCGTEGCGKIPSFGVAGTKTTKYCAQHARDGMVNVKNRMCKTKGCGKIPAFGVAGTKNRRVLLTARTGQDGQRRWKKVQNRRLREATVIWSGRYENGGVLCAARPG